MYTFSLSVFLFSRSLSFSLINSLINLFIHSFSLSLTRARVRVRNLNKPKEAKVPTKWTTENAQMKPIFVCKFPRPPEGEFRSQVKHLFSSFHKRHLLVNLISFLRFPLSSSSFTLSLESSSDPRYITLIPNAICLAHRVWFNRVFLTSALPPIAHNKNTCTFCLRSAKSLS